MDDRERRRSGSLCAVATGCEGGTRASALTPVGALASPCCSVSGAIFNYIPSVSGAILNLAAPPHGQLRVAPAAPPHGRPRAAPAGVSLCSRHRVRGWDPSLCTDAGGSTGWPLLLCVRRHLQPDPLRVRRHPQPGGILHRQLLQGLLHLHLLQEIRTRTGGESCVVAEIPLDYDWSFSGIWDSRHCVAGRD